MPGKRNFLVTVFHKEAILPIFLPEFTERVIDILSHLDSIVWPTMVGLVKRIFKMVLRWLENASLLFIFANTLNPSFNYTFFQLLYKLYATFNSSKIT